MLMVTCDLIGGTDERTDGAKAMRLFRAWVALAPVGRDGFKVA